MNYGVRFNTSKKQILGKNRSFLSINQGLLGIGEHITLLARLRRSRNHLPRLIEKACAYLPSSSQEIDGNNEIHIKNLDSMKTPIYRGCLDSINNLPKTRINDLIENIDQKGIVVARAERSQDTDHYIIKFYKVEDNILNEEECNKMRDAWGLD